MPNIIQLLPENIASKIAAGEVIQRPASVFKELVENAIDAQATKITIHVKDGGKSFIQVIDNGVGMSPEDARLCFEKHATSKLKSIEDLFNIYTKGFRGEALPSIAAVTHVELKTKKNDTELGTHLIIEDNKVLLNEACACETGSSFTIKNLFFSIPARKNFLKDDILEFKYIVDEFERLAIPHYNIQFTLTHNDKIVYQLPVANSLFSRIEFFLDNVSKDKFFIIQDETPAFELKAFVGNPDVAKKKRAYQMIFINNRFIKHNYIAHAVYEAFKGIIPPDHHPQFFLFFKINPARIDWNIHPAKIEARLLDEKIIYPFLVSVIKKGLGVSGITQTIDFSTNTHIDMRDIRSDRTAPPPIIKYDSNYNPFHSPQEQKTTMRNWESFFKIFQEEGIKKTETEEQGHLEVSSNALHIVPEVTQWLNKYIVCVYGDKLILIDQHRAHEKIIYEQLKSQQHAIEAQTLMFPLHIDLSANDFLIMQELLPAFQKIGFQIEEFGNNSIIIHAHPHVVNSSELAAIIDNTIENYRLSQLSEVKEINESFLRSISKSMAVKYGQTLTKQELLDIVYALFATHDFNYTSAGKKIIKEILREDISNFFKK